MNTPGSRHPRDLLAVALDVASRAEAAPLIRTLAPHVGWFKVGLQLYAAAGPDAVKQVVDAGAKAFVDLKLHDIPNTVKGAVRSLRETGASLCTVHASGGRAMIRAAVEAAAEAAPASSLQPSAFSLKIIAVTALTSLDDAAIAEIGMIGGAAAAVERLLKLTVAAGGHGCVMSPAELAMARAVAPHDFLIVTPGIRAPGDAAGDQARTATPSDAVAAGSDLLVVGRPITGARDPAGRAQEILADINSGLIEQMR